MATRAQREARRIVPRAGVPLKIRRIGIRESVLGDLYHALVTQRWWVLGLLGFLVYLGLNLLFTLLYMLGGDCVANMRPGSFVDAFAFSVQTLATIGYGVMHPQTLYAHVVVAFEAFTGVLAFAVITGIAFTKFSRPTSRVVFSRVAVVTPHEGTPALMFRMANERAHSRIVEAQVRVTYTRDETTREGVQMRRFYDLKLQRDSTPIFALSWIAIHVIDESSPLFGETHHSLCQKNVEIVVSFMGLDEHLSQTQHGRHSYIADEIVFGARFADVMLLGEDGARVFDYTKFHETV